MRHELLLHLWEEVVLVPTGMCLDDPCLCKAQAGPVASSIYPHVIPVTLFIPHNPPQIQHGSTQAFLPHISPHDSREAARFRPSPHRRM